jgi:signal peptidase I
MQKAAILLAACIVGLVGVGSALAYSYWACLFDGRRVVQITSNDMRPALSSGDTVLIQPVSSVRDVFADYSTGDIICFRKPGDPDVLVVHRAIQNVTDGLRTKADSSASEDFWIVGDDDLVGKVVEVNSFPIAVVGSSLLWSGAAVALAVAIVVLYGSLGRARTGREPASAEEQAQPAPSTVFCHCTRTCARGSRAEDD